MKKTTSIAFIFGAAIGSIVTWCFTKKHYEKLAHEEIESVKEAFSKRKVKTEPEPDGDSNSDKGAFEIVKDIPEIEEDDGIVIEDPSMLKQAEDIIYDESYIMPPFEPSDRMSLEERVNAKPIVISPDEFGEIFEYDQIELVYYADGILAEREDIISNIDDIVGYDFADHFGEYEEDSVYIRNDRLRAEYAIIQDERNFYDVFKYMSPRDYDEDYPEV